jgi:hypothetical protein
VTTGVYSYADLEANYRGFQFLNSLCSPSTEDLAVSTRSARIIQLDNGVWSLKGHVHFEDFVNPKWNELYNPSRFRKRIWKSVEHQIRQQCFKVPLYKETLSTFTSYLWPYKNDYFERYMSDLEARRLPNRDKMSFYEICKPYTKD